MGLLDYMNHSLNLFFDLGFVDMGLVFILVSVDDLLLVFVDVDGPFFHSFLIVPASFVKARRMAIHLILEPK